jgi:hypothetical protein
MSNVIDNNNTAFWESWRIIWYKRNYVSEEFAASIIRLISIFHSHGRMNLNLKIFGLLFYFLKNVMLHATK